MADFYDLLNEAFAEFGESLDEEMTNGEVTKLLAYVAEINTEAVVYNPALNRRIKIAQNICSLRGGLIPTISKQMIEDLRANIIAIRVWQKLKTNETKPQFVTEIENRYKIKPLNYAN